MVWSVVSSAFGDGRRSRKAVLGRILAYGSVFLSRARAERSTSYSASSRWACALRRRDRMAARRGLTFSASIGNLLKARKKFPKKRIPQEAIRRE